MIDEYYHVQINRISPEYPVAVMLSQNNVVTKPGGVANVAYQFKNTGAEVHLMCFYDTDAFDCYYAENLNPFYLNESARLPDDKKAKLPIKRRFVDNNIQVAPRQDIEFKNCNLSDKLIDDYYLIAKQFIRESPKPNAVILSDYNKGFFSSERNFIELYDDTITIVDPKSNNLSKWKNCTVFKPNKKEAFELSGLTDWKLQCDFFKKELNCKAVIITDSGNGIVGISDDEYFQYQPPFINSVESVIGAGDCFAAFLALALSHGFNPIDSAKIAYHAGLVYVKQKENRPIVLADLIQNKIIEPRDLVYRDFSLAFTNGCFDILHTGHLETLKFAKSKADKLVVAINTDKSVKFLKGDTRPIVPLIHRMNVLANLSMVDYLIPFDDDTPIDLIRLIRPENLIKGADYQNKDVVGKEFVDQVYFAPFIDNFSSTSIIDAHRL
jgi:D-beta-D-heptose 7-phosphate kinase/D-beta-D-heptose 1-phosphate adenosyltransferase